jgi:hypothetical protein
MRPEIFLHRILKSQRGNSKDFSNLNLKNLKAAILDDKDFLYSRNNPYLCEQIITKNKIL